MVSKKSFCQLVPSRHFCDVFGEFRTRIAKRIAYTIQLTLRLLRALTRRLLLIVLIIARCLPLIEKALFMSRAKTTRKLSTMAIPVVSDS